MFEKLLEILDQDEKALTLLKEFNQMVVRHNITGEALEKAKEVFFLGMVLKSDKAMKALSDYTWIKLNQA
jgi:hypothetical protein